LNWVHSRHDWKLGGAYIWIRGSNRGAGASNGLFTFDGSVTGNALVDFLLGNASLTQNNGVLWRTHSQDPSVFVQDDYRISRQLTFNIGMRWEFFPPYSGQNNMGTFVAGVQSTRFPTAPLGLLTSGDKGIPDGILLTPWDTFAPRVGFAYDVFGKGLTSLRGAYGVFYSALEQPLWATLIQQPFSLSVTVFRTPNLISPFAPNPDPFPYVVSPASAAFLSGASIFSLPPRVRNIPSAQQFSLGIQQQYGPKWSSEIEYVGNVARHLYISFDQNSPIYDSRCTSITCGTTLSRNRRRPYQPTPATYTFSSISLYAPVANASYHSLQATLAHKFDRHFFMRASFVWSKAIGYGPLTNAYDLSSSRGVLDVDVPRSFAASYIFSSPDIRRSGALAKWLLSGWQINGITILRSGQPFNVTSGTDSNFDGTNNDRPNVVGLPSLAKGRGRMATVKEFFNTAAFATPPAGTPYGNAPFNMLYGPGYVETDLSAFRTFSVRENIALQFRGEVFNIFNNVNMSAPNSTESSPAFGVISSAAAPRNVQLAFRLSF
jgi:hypothetical protein